MERRASRIQSRQDFRETGEQLGSNSTTSRVPFFSLGCLFKSAAPIVVCLLLVLLLGLYIPPPLETLLRQAADFVEGKR